MKKIYLERIKFFMIFNLIFGGAGNKSKTRVVYKE